MTRPRGADDHAVGVEVRAWAGNLSLDTRRDEDLGDLCKLAVDVLQVACCVWDRRDVADAFGCKVSEVTVATPSLRARAERSLRLAVDLDGRARGWAADRGWCVELIEEWL